MKGAEEYYSMSLYKFGSFCEEGKGVEKDLKKAHEFF